ncbi:MAG: SDR family NAD(P)-dependent oxidoreductase [Gammaproteobacteria bacterium]|nr:SDR family NAD(P)-dependent oxidoreductase [Gammaproteobacteria bacterium]
MPYRRIGGAVRAAVYDSLTARDAIPVLSPTARIDGRLCLVTGANSGLGMAVATDLAARGGRVLMACRSGHHEARDDVRRASGSDDVAMFGVDLADLDSVHRFCDELRERRLVIDVAVLNAGLMTRTARRSRQGYELMFAVHFLANRIMVDRWLRDGVLQPGRGRGGVPRIVQVTSETHRSADPIDFDRFGEFVDFGMRDGLKYYGQSKLHSCTFAQELDRRLNPDGNVRAAVHAVCPGPVASNIAREAPVALKVARRPLMAVFFSSPVKAARPVSYLCCGPDAGSRSGIYLHMMRETQPSAPARDPAQGDRLWRASQKLVDQYDPSNPALGR